MHIQNTQRGSSLRRTFLLTLAGFALAASSASAALRTYNALWSGASDGNRATAVGTVVIDDALLLNPGDSGADFGVAGAAVVDFTITISDASSGNGTFTASDFESFFVNITDALDLNKNWIGQAQPTSENAWGDPNSESHDFNVFHSNPAAPEGTFYYDLTTNGGLGDTMRLVAFTPDPLPPGQADLVVGAPVLNVPGATVGSVSPAALGRTGVIYLSGKLKGGTVKSETDDVILAHASSGHNIAILRAGAALLGSTIKSFGDPILATDFGDDSDDQIFVKTTLNESPEIDAKHNDVLMVIGPSVEFPGTFPIAGEGDEVLLPAGFRIRKFDWIHGTPTGAFFGAQLVNPATPDVKGFGVYFAPAFGLGPVRAAGPGPGLITVPIVYAGGQVDINGTPTTIKSISKPTASKPAGNQTRVGNGEAIVLTLKTAGGGAAVRGFPAPDFSPFRGAAAVAGAHAKGYGPRRR